MSYSRPVALKLKDDDLYEQIKRLRPRGRCSVSDVLHALHVFSLRPEWLGDDGPTMSELWAVLLDQRVAEDWFSGTSSVLRTRSGYAFATVKSSPWVGAAGQAHLDQVLTAFADSGFDANLSITLEDGGSAAIRDFLAESEANFSLEGEFEWSVVANLRYNPARSSWTNRFGELFTAEKVTCFLIASPLRGRSCGGTHSLMALAAISQIDAAFDILRQDVRRLLRSYLKATAQFVCEQQAEDGSFDPLWSNVIARQSWYRDFVSRAEQFASGQFVVDEDVPPLPTVAARLYSGARPQKVLATGHLTEWLQMLDRESQPRLVVFDRAGRFLLASITAAPDREIWDNYCPYSHAAGALISLSK